MTAFASTTRATAPRGPIGDRGLGWLLVITGAIGFVSAFTLLVEKIALLENPSYVPSCTINPILSCDSVMRTPQAEVFGFPNPILGVTGFSVVVTLGVLRVARTDFPRWVWAGLQLGVIFGVVFIHWLIFQSLYRIDALCPYCMVVWSVMIPLFWYVTLNNLSLGYVRVPDRLRGLVGYVLRFHGVGLTLWFLVIVALIAERFWDYWRTLLT